MHRRSRRSRHAKSLASLKFDVDNVYFRLKKACCFFESCEKLRFKVGSVVAVAYRLLSGTVRGQNIWGGVVPQFPSLPLLFPSISLPSPFPFSPPLFPCHSLEVGPLNTARGCGEALKAPPAGFGADPQRKLNFVHFSLKI